MARPIKLNIGPGRSWSKANWQTLDFYNTDADYLSDLRGSPRLPLPTHSVRMVFSSHVIEHLSDEAVTSLFREVYRVLQYGGTFRVSCPDAARAVKQYRKGDCDPNREAVSRDALDAPSHLRLLNVLASFRAARYRGKTSRGRAFYSGGPFASERAVRRHVKVDSLDQLGKWAVSLIPEDATYKGHINAHWPAKVVQMLRSAGFRTVYVSRFRRSRVRELRGPAFDNRPTISLFVEAQASGWPKFLQRVLRAIGRRLRHLWPRRAKTPSGH